MKALTAKQMREIDYPKTVGLPNRFWRWHYCDKIIVPTPERRDKADKFNAELTGSSPPQEMGLVLGSTRLDL